jgi:hypothetical protein
MINFPWFLCVLKPYLETGSKIQNTFTFGDKNLYNNKLQDIGANFNNCS